MTLTETEAKTKWCPFARRDAGGVVVNRNMGGNAFEGCKCIASACMAWRDDRGVAGKGFCGLAGAP